MNPTSSTDRSKISLNEQTKFRLNEINKIKDYFKTEIKERAAIITKLSKYITSFDYTYKILIFLATTFSGISIFSHLKIKKHTGLISLGLNLIFSLSTGIIKKSLYETKKRKKQHNKVLCLGKNKIDCIEMLISQAIIDLQIGYEEFKMIVDEKKEYDNQKNIMNGGAKSKLSENV